MTDTRRKAAEEWALKSADTPGQQADMFDAHLAGQECGEKREREAVVKWLRHEVWRWNLPFVSDMADIIERGEHREGE